MGPVRHLRQRQQVVLAERVGGFPNLAIFVESADRHVELVVLLGGNLQIAALTEPIRIWWTGWAFAEVGVLVVFILFCLSGLCPFSGRLFLHQANEKQRPGKGATTVARVDQESGEAKPKQGRASLSWRRALRGASRRTVRRGRRKATGNTRATPGKVAAGSVGSP